MAAIVATGIVGRVTWLGVVPSRAAALASVPREHLRLSFDGPDGEDHGGATRPACSRVRALHPRHTPIRNARQASILCADEIAAVAATMGVDRLDPAWLGATIVLQGIPDFSHVPPSSRLQGPDGATLTVDMLNRPCVLPGPVIDRALPGAGRLFKAAAEGRRGVVGWVEREGVLRLGDAVTLFVPGQRAWRGASAESERGPEREDQTADEAGMDQEAGGGHGIVLSVAAGGSSPTSRHRSCGVNG